MSSSLSQLLQQSKRVIENQGLPCTVYEAGCGSSAIYQGLIDPAMYVIGVDMCECQLERNVTNSISILGDVETLAFEPDSVDFVVCFDVLEHLKSPFQALARFDECLKPNGFILLAFPNIWSLKGMITALTPYWFHKLFYRFIIGDKTAMTQQGRQFKTYLGPRLTYRRVIDYFDKKQYHSHLSEVYQGPVPEHLVNKHRFYRFAFWCASLFGKFLTLGRVDLRHSDVFILLQKPEVAHV